MKTRNAGIVLSYANTILNVLCGLFLSSFLLRILGDTDYGIYQTVCSFAYYLVLLEFGTGTVITRNLVISRASGDSDSVQKNISTIWTVNTLLTVVIVAASVAFYSGMDRIYQKTLTAGQILYAKKIFAFEAVFLVVSFFTSVTNGILMGFEHYHIEPIISIVKLVSRTILLVVLVLSYRASLVIAVVDMVISIAVLVFSIRYCVNRLSVRFTFKYFDKDIFIKSLPLSLAVFVQVTVNLANSNVDKFFLGIRVSPESVAVYSVGLLVYSIFSSLTIIPVSMYSPQVIKEVERGLYGRELENMLARFSRLTVIIGGTVLFGFCAVGKQFITILYGESYLKAWYVSIIILIPMLAAVSNGIVKNVMDAKNLSLARSCILLASTVGNIILTGFWIDRYGMLGACAATAVCTAAGQVILMDIYYIRKLKLDVWYMYRKTFSGILLPQMVSAGVAYIAATCIPNACAGFICGGILYCILFAVLFFVSGSNRTEADLFRNRLKRKMAGK